MTDQERFWIKVDKSKSCWIWTSAILKNGYGVFNLEGKTVYAHRLSFLWHHGRLSPPLVIDHKCRNRRCVNPDHLHEITRGRNVQIGIKANSLKTQCPKGHDYDKVAKRGDGSTFRFCSSCARVTKRKWAKFQEEK